MKLRYDNYEPDGVLDAAIIRADCDGEPCEPLLLLTDEDSGFKIHLTRALAWKLRDIIDRM